MKRHLVTLLGLSLAAALGAAGGCGSETAEPALDPVEAVGQAMNPSFTNHYYRVMADYRWCVVAPCTGYTLTRIDSVEPVHHVGTLDFGETGFDEGQIGAVTGAPPGGVVLYGTFTAPPSPGLPSTTFVVRRAFRGMPGVRAPAGSAYYVVEDRDPPIECFAAPCDNEIAVPLETADTVAFTTLSVAPAAAMPSVDQTWLADRVRHHGAVVAGHFRDGALTPSGAERVLEADQVFVRLPDATGVCLLPHHVCRDGLHAVYTRNVDRCLVFQACIRDTGVCQVELPPRCAPGYTMSRWPADSPTCVGVACDPAFLAE